MVSSSSFLKVVIKKVGKVENSGTTTPHRRNYSDADLQAALREIRSGQLGTRKASIIYGVPRSTLRNKVYKLQANDRRVSALAVSRAAVEDQRKERVLDADCEIDVEAVDGDGGSPPSGGDWIGSSRVVMSSELATNSGAASPVQLRRRQFSGASEGCRSPNSANPGLELSLKDVIARTVTNRLSKVGSGVEEKIDPSDPKSAARTTRPKRGKYRNYDQASFVENLLEAVKAVQRGEMSVHRAGTFYGVPHSTLEYKVKERHLMRPRKRPRKDELMSSTLHPRGDVESSASSENNAPRRRESGSSSESDSCVEVPLSLSAPPAPAKSGNGNGIAPAYFPPNYTPLGIPPSYMFWGSRPAFHPHATPLAPLPTLEANNPFSRWLACKPWSMDNASPRSESGLTFEEARRQWLKSSPPGIVEQNLTSSTLSAAAVKIEDRNGPSYKDDLRAAIVAMEKAVEDEAS
ncbi:unnamed protein product [Notodromas monacha]|uniref:HTH psq-type domain-containing protein n=1 Tax=Notodromas monacha TaxID=399045 RepID=A0A7R9BGQ2_9CRUS|nr:unnamed protein product [Notodromas monacha]CAG0914445.1 unnamed protein product [Notodromas monacha]